MNPYKFILFFATFGLVFTSCRLTKNVPDGHYLVKKNKVNIIGDQRLPDNYSSMIKQQPNMKTLGLKMKLMVFNSVDSAKVQDKRIKKNLKLREKNQKRIAKQNRINQHRIEEARAKGEDLYTQKIVSLKDTVEPRMFLREWLKYKIGEAPVIFDSTLFAKSLEQLDVFLRKKGYYYGCTDGEVEIKGRKKIKVKYTVETGPRYLIDSVYFQENSPVNTNYQQFLKKNPDRKLEGKPFDEDYLGDYRFAVAKFMRDEAFYGFSPSHITYLADTNATKMTVSIGLKFSDRLVQSKEYPDSLVAIPHRTYRINDVHFVINDTLNFKGNFQQTVENKGFNLNNGVYFTTIDTLYYSEIYYSKSEKRNRKIPVEKDSLNPYRMAYFHYNGTPAVDPAVIEMQNYLEHTHYYKEYYVERSYTRFLQLGVFQTIKPVIIEIPGSNLLDVYYYLTPSEKQSFSLEPRATNSNGFLGVAASLNYANKNLFRGAERFTFSISGGFESQPPIFDESLDGNKIKKAGRSFNTFEIGPSIKYEAPGLLPFPVTGLSKRHRAKTIISAAYNFQNRSDFDREIVQMNYLWRWYVGKTQTFQLGLPAASVIKFVDITKAPDFEAKINLLNDLFLRNSYNDQFIWQDWKVTFEYNNKDQDNKKSNSTIYFNSSVDPAGNVLSLFKEQQDTTEFGQKAVFGLGYSQFIRMDNEAIFIQPLQKQSSLNLKLQVGGGKPYGNTITSLPYDYGFFGGGANDNRGWRARALGPGAYKYYLDTNRTATQIGDFRIGASTEYRFSLGGMFKGAFFLDAGNIWTIEKDINRIGSKLSKTWFNEIAVSSGVGLRMDLDFFIIRLDLGIPLSNPALPNGAKWIWQSRSKYIQEGKDFFGEEVYAKYLPKPFTPVFHFGIGYPF